MDTPPQGNEKLSINLQQVEHLFPRCENLAAAMSKPAIASEKQIREKPNMAMHMDNLKITNIKGMDKARRKRKFQTKGFAKSYVVSIDDPFLLSNDNLDQNKLETMPHRLPNHAIQKRKLEKSKTFDDNSSESNEMDESVKDQGLEELKRQADLQLPPIIEETLANMDPKILRKLRAEFGSKQVPSKEISEKSVDKQSLKEEDFFCQTTPLKANLEIVEDKKSEARPSSAKAGNSKRNSMAAEVQDWNHLNLEIPRSRRSSSNASSKRLNCSNFVTAIQEQSDSSSCGSKGMSTKVQKNKNQSQQSKRVAKVVVSDQDDSGDGTPSLKFDSKKGSFLNLALQQKFKGMVYDNESTRRSILSHGSKDHLTIDMVTSILMRDPSMRNEEDKEILHIFMKQNIQFFQSKKEQAYLTEAQKSNIPKLTKEDKMNLYEVMKYRMFKKGDVLCRYKDIGDRFFIILEGEVEVRIPMDKFLAYNCTWDVYQYVFQQYKHIRLYRDEVTKLCSHVINIFGRKFLKNMDFKHVQDFIDFLTKAQRLDHDLLQEHPHLDASVLKQEVYSIRTFKERLIKEMPLIEETPTGSMGISVSKKKQIQTKLQVMEKVNVINQGGCFGQDSLIEDTTRNATCTAMSRKLITVILTKPDYKRVVQPRQKQHRDRGLDEIMRFDLFSKDKVNRRQLKKFFRDFYDKETEFPYVKSAGEYLYKQGDPVEQDGIYCILQGSVRKMRYEITKNEKSAKKTVQEINNVNEEISAFEELKMKKRKHKVIQYIDKGCTFGADEIVKKLPTRQYSMQVVGVLPKKEQPKPDKRPEVKRCLKLLNDNAAAQDSSSSHGSSSAATKQVNNKDCQDCTEIQKCQKCEISVRNDPEGCVYLFLPTKTFRDQFLNANGNDKLTHNICQNVEERIRFEDKLCQNKQMAENWYSGIKLTDKKKIADEDQKREEEENFVDVPTPKKLPSSIPQNIKNLSKTNFIKNNSVQDAKLETNQQQPRESWWAEPWCLALRKQLDLDKKSSALAQSQQQMEKTDPNAATIVTNLTSTQSMKHDFRPIEIIRKDKLDRLDNQIEYEINKQDPKIKELTRIMSERRQHLAEDKQEKIIDEKIGHSHLSSVSKTGKFTESKIVQYYGAVHENESERKKLQKQNEKLNIDIITSRLNKDVGQMSSRWKTERTEGHKVQMMLHSISKDKRVQESLLKFKKHLPSFIKYLHANFEWGQLKQLKIPSFKGSLLLDTKPIMAERGGSLSCLEEIVSDDRSVQRREHESQSSNIQSIQTMRPLSKVDKKRSMFHNARAMHSIIIIEEKQKSPQTARKPPVLSQKTSLMQKQETFEVAKSIKTAKTFQGRTPKSKRGKMSSATSHFQELDEEQNDIIKVFHKWFEKYEPSKNAQIRKQMITQGSQKSNIGMSETNRNTERPYSNIGGMETPGGLLSPGTLRHDGSNIQFRQQSVSNLEGYQALGVLTARSTAPRLQNVNFSMPASPQVNLPPQRQQTTVTPVVKLNLDKLRQKRKRSSAQQVTFESKAADSQNFTGQHFKAMAQLQKAIAQDTGDEQDQEISIQNLDRSSFEQQQKQQNQDLLKTLNPTSPTFSESEALRPLDKKPVQNSQQIKWQHQNNFVGDKKRHPYMNEPIPEELYVKPAFNEEANMLKLTQKSQLQFGQIKTQPQTSKNISQSILFTGNDESSLRPAIEILDSKEDESHREQEDVSVSIPGSRQESAVRISVPSETNHYQSSIPQQSGYLTNINTNQAANGGGLQYYQITDRSEVNLQVQPQNKNAQTVQSAKQKGSLYLKPSILESVDMKSDDSIIQPLETENDVVQNHEDAQIAQTERHLIDHAIEIADQQLAKQVNNKMNVQQLYQQDNFYLQEDLKQKQDKGKVADHKQKMQQIAQSSKRKVINSQMTNYHGQLTNEIGLSKSAIKTVDFNSLINQNMRSMPSLHSTGHQMSNMLPTTSNFTPALAPAHSTKKFHWVSPLAMLKQDFQPKSLGKHSSMMIRNPKQTQSQMLIQDRTSTRLAQESIQQQLTNIQIDPSDKISAQMQYFSEKKTLTRQLRHHQTDRASVPSSNVDDNQISKAVFNSIKMTSGKEVRKSKIQGLHPTTKVLISQPNPRFSYQSNFSGRPTMASVMLDKVSSEAKLQRPTNQLKISEMSRNSTMDVIDVNPRDDIVDQSHQLKPSIVSVKQGKRLKLSKKKQRTQKKSISQERVPSSKVKPYYAKDMFNPIVMSKNLQLQAIQMQNRSNEKVTQQKRQPQQQKFIEKTIQELQKKAKVTASRVESGYQSLERQTKPALFGSLEVAKLNPSMPYVSRAPNSTLHGQQFINVDSIGRQSKKKYTNTFLKSVKRDASQLQSPDKSQQKAQQPDFDQQNDDEVVMTTQYVNLE